MFRPHFLAIDRPARGRGRASTSLAASPDTCRADTAAPRRIPFVLLAVVLLASLLSTGCSIKRMAVKNVANSLTSGPDVFASDDDPDLIRSALPFGLKLLESLLTMVPDHQGLLMTACRGYTQYAFAFVELDADLAERTDRRQAEHLRERALKLYLRARRFGLTALEYRHKGIADQLLTQPDLAVAKLTVEDLPVAYWTGAAWGSAISVGKDKPELTADIASVKALMTRSLALGETYEQGAVHEALILLDALPEMMGGSPRRAREHFERAVAISKGTRVAPYVMLAQSVSIQSQNRGEFERLLKQALAINPDANPQSRLETLLLQQKARSLLEQEDELFLDSKTESDTTHVEESK